MNALHQYLARAVVDDPVTEAVLWRARILRRLGLKSEVYASRAPAELARAIRPAATYAAADSVPVLVQATGSAEAVRFTLHSKRIVLTASALQDESEEWLRSWAQALGGRVIGGLSEGMTDPSRDGWQHTPPMFDGSRAARRAPVLPDVPVGRFLVIASARHRKEVDRIAARASDQLKKPIDVRTVDADHPAELAGLFRRADAFLWAASEGPVLHPLLALAFDVPVLAADTARAQQLLGALVTTEWNRASAANALTTLLGDTATRRERLKHQHAQRARLEEARVACLEVLVAQLGLKAQKVALPERPTPRIVIEGSFETSYSLDVTNRELARALDRAVPGQVGLFPTHGYGDYRPKDADLAHQPDLIELWRHSRSGGRPEILVRGMYPPRVADMRGRRNVLHFAWEESNVPSEWVAEFNRRLDGLVVVSTFVRKVLIDAGVRVPIFVIGNGIDQALTTPRAELPEKLGRGFKFLHVSSAFPRKGIDVLLRAYANAFDTGDDVTLVLKTFPNEHHHIERDLAALREDVPRLADVVLINRDVPPGQLIDLYHRCDALVAPSRGEGFGLPMAEAMALGLPVITTGHGGVLDFAEPESTWLIDFTFSKAQSHMGLFDSVWAEPNVGELARAMQRVAALPAKVRRRTTERARELVTQEHSWDRVATRFSSAVAQLEAPPPPRKPLRLGWVSSWNTRCGIAAYSARLMEALPKDAFDLRIFASQDHERRIKDEPFVQRCWTDHRQLDLSPLETAIVDAGCESVVLHFNFGFFDVRAFGDLLRCLRERGIGRVVVFHATRDRSEGTALSRIAPELARCDRLLVHGVGDLNVLKRVGLVANVALFPHGVIATEVTERSRQAAKLGLGGKRVIGTYGYLRAHKGLLETVRALPAIFAIHPKAHLLMVNARYPSPDSDSVRDELKRAIDELRLGRHVTLVDDYLEDAQSLSKLAAAELIAFPYQNTLESSSAAVRFGLSSHRPVVCTPLGIFEDVGDAVQRFTGTSVPEIAAGINDLLAHPEKLSSSAKTQEAWLTAHAWPTVTTRLAGMLEALRKPAQVEQATRSA